MKLYFEKVILVILLNLLNEYFCQRPVVLWHGMGDSCCFPFSLGKIKKAIEEQIPGIYVVSIRIGNSIPEDVKNGYFKPVNEQIEMVCNQINNDPKLKNGFNAIGLSQGSQFLRGLAEKCNTKMYNLISLGGQHQGIYGIPNCASLNHATCDYIRNLLNIGAYWSWVQKGLVQASYWHDPLNEEKYRQYSIFLADINNERTVNEIYKDRLKKLNKLVLVKFLNDSIVQPVETEWFGFYQPGQSKIVQNMTETDLYKNDLLGLKMLNENGRIDFLWIEGDHLQFTIDWFTDNIIFKYLV